MQDMYEKAEACYEGIRTRVPFIPMVGLVLGSGLGSFAENPDIQIVGEIPYQEIDRFPVSTVSGHKGRFVFAYVEQVPVVMMQGRVHYYEGYPIQDVVLPIRLMRLMGAEILILTNAAGGANAGFAPGDLMMITDHIASFVPSPLIGPNEERWGKRFPDMSQVYAKSLQSIITQAAEELHISLQRGVYLQLTGPAYETPAEVQMCIRLGADAIGMSTACEAVAARHMGMKICGISLITNHACGLTDKPLSHEEVQEAALGAAETFEKLMKRVILLIGQKEQ